MNRKEIKRRGFGLYKSNMLKVIAICLLMAMVAGEYGGLPRIFTQYDETMEVKNVVEDTITQKENAAIIGEILEDQSKEDGHVLGAPKTERREKTKYTQGVLASIFNHMTDSGSFVIGVLGTLNEGVFKGRFLQGTILLMGLVVSALLYIFVQNILLVGECRFFLELYTYKETPLRRILHIYNVKRVYKVAVVMLKRSVYQFLWNLTVVGGIIKHYSYLMIPYIVAENPNIESHEVFEISRQMMHGYKWDAFVIDLSYIGWNILGYLTYGITDMCYLNPVKASVFSAFYLERRKQLHQGEESDSFLLNDLYLDCAPMEEGHAMVYPMELYTIPENKKAALVNVNYMRKYTFFDYVLLFFGFSFVGWCWEVSIHLVEDGIFVNRGVLLGPWLPIYGTGGVLILLLLKKIRQNKWLTFVMVMVVCGIVEYFTSWALEKMWHLKWWDYSGYLLTLHGRICAEGLLVFGVGGVAFIYAGAPLMAKMFDRISLDNKKVICFVLCFLFVLDCFYSYRCPNTGQGITDYKQQVYIGKDCTRTGRCDMIKKCAEPAIDVAAQMR